MRQLIAMSSPEDEERKLMREALGRIAGLDIDNQTVRRDVGAMSDTELTVDALRRYQDVLARESERIKGQVAEMSSLKDDTERMLREARDDHEKQRAELVAEIRKLRDQVDEDKIQLRILYAVDEACAKRDEEIRTLRGGMAERDSRIAELERSKKKLREAVQRLSEKT